MMGQLFNTCIGSIILFALHSNILAQNQTATWNFGLFAGLNFMTSPPTVLNNSAMWSQEGCASISDPSGNLLCYTDGQTLYNKLHVPMANGTVLGGNMSTTQSALYVKQPGNSNIYFLFTLGTAPAGGTLRYSVIDMQLSAGNGSVVSKGNVLATGCSEKLSGTMHCNGSDVWVASHLFNSQDFLVYLVTNTGVSTPVVSTIGSIHAAGNFLNNAGYMKFSPDGKKIGIALHDSIHTFELFDFDNINGVVSNSLSLGKFPSAYGCEFSPDGTKFYGSCESGIFGNKLLQWNLCEASDSAIAASLYTLATSSPIHAMQLAKNGRIYVTKSGADSLDVINKPNYADSACNYIHNGQTLAPQTGMMGLSNFISSYFQAPPPPFTYTLDPAFGCQTASFTPPFTPNEVDPSCAVGYSLVGTEWDFGDPQTGSANFSSLSNPTHSFTNYGSYTVQLILHYSCGGRPDTLEQQVDVVPLPPLQVSLSSNSLCSHAFNGSANTITFTSSGASTYTLITAAPATSTAQTDTSGQVSTGPPYSPAGISTATLYGTVGACTTSLVTTFSIIPNPAVSISHSPVICVGDTYTYTSAGAESYTWTSSTPNFTTHSNGGFAVTNPTTNAIFTVYGTSLNCQSALVTSTLSVYPIPTVSVVPGTTSICPETSATLQTIGTATFFSWMPEVNNNSTQGASVIASPEHSQQYTVVASRMNCTNSAVADIVVFTTTVPTASASSYKACAGDTIILTATGGESFQWHFPNQFTYSGTTLKVHTYSQAMAGEYMVIATDMNGCKKSASVGIDVAELPTGALRGLKSGCVPFCPTFNFDNHDTANIKAIWTVNGQPFFDDFRYCFTKSGEHMVSGKIMDRRSGCYSTDTLLVTAIDKPQAAFSWYPERPVEREEVRFENHSAGKEQMSWDWHFSTGSSLNGEIANRTFNEAGLYPVAFVVKNHSGCIDTVIRKVEVTPEFLFFVPNAFTPNGDGINDRFEVLAKGVKSFSFYVYNRWGELLFETTDSASGWVGDYKGMPCKQDTYVWKAVVSEYAGGLKEYTGSVFLYR